MKRILPGVPAELLREGQHGRVRVGLELALTRLVAAWQDALIAAGHGEEDSSALGRIGRGDVTP